MKTITLAVVVVGLFIKSYNNQQESLSLLNFKQDFKPEITDVAFKIMDDTSDIIMLGIEKIVPQSASNSGLISYGFLISTMQPKLISELTFVKDNYFGYYIYKGHTVLVYDDGSAARFFSKAKYKKRFGYLKQKIHDINNPPLVDEKPYYYYEFIDGKFSPPRRSGF